MGEAFEAVDRISELPPFIIHKIMSRLPREQVVKTSALSKRWNNLWQTFPVLDFDNSFFIKAAGHSINRNKCIEKFIEYIDAFLLRFCQYNLSMQKFGLLTSLLDSKRLCSRAPKWISLAVEHEVKEFEFQVFTRGSTMYTLPQTIFSAKSVTTLYLAGVKLEEPHEGHDRVRLLALKRLNLYRVFINEQLIEKLTAECPLLEDFSLNCCWGFKHLRVFKSLKLKTMKVDTPSDVQLEKIEISVPSLQQFFLSYSLARKPVVDLADSTNLVKLGLFCINFTDQEFHHLIKKFPLLHHLDVSHCKLLERITISSDQLKNLGFGRCDNLKEIYIDTPNLLSFYYRDSPIPIASINAPCPWKVDFRYYFLSQGDLDICWFRKLKEFFSESNKIEDLTIGLQSNKISFNLNEVRESKPSFPCQVGNLELDIGVLSSDYNALMDGLFWIAYPRTLSLIKKEIHHEFIKWLYQELRYVSANCCNSHHSKCWRHHLKDIKIRMEDGKLLDINNYMDISVV